RRSVRHARVTAAARGPLDAVHSGVSRVPARAFGRPAPSPGAAQHAWRGARALSRGARPPLAVRVARAPTRPAARLHPVSAAPGSYASNAALRWSRPPWRIGWSRG